MAVAFGSSTFGHGPGVVTIGNFDGVHQGHQALLQRAAELTRGPVIAYTFDPAPRDILRPECPVQRIQTLDDRVDRLLRSGADHVVVEAFSVAFGRHSAEWFATTVLSRRLRATAVVVGWDFRFGSGRAGTADQLRHWLEVPVIQVAAIQSGPDPVSSSRIRALLHQGEVEAAGELLGRPHEVVGTVIHGEGRGRTLGFPTANLQPLTPLIPAAGVYAVEVEHNNTCFDGVANIGTRPTFPDRPLGVEIHIFDLDTDLYGETLRARFLHRLRDEQVFASVPSLVAQIRSDVHAARALLKP